MTPTEPQHSIEKRGSDPGRITRFALWCAGSDYRYMAGSRIELARHTTLGLFVILTAVAATGSMMLALNLAIPNCPAYVFLPAGVLWGSVIFVIDRWLVSTIPYGPLDASNTGDAPKGRGRLVGYAVRLALAVVISLSISEVVVLALFRPEIEQTIGTIQNEQKGESEAAIRSRPEFLARRTAIDAARDQARTAATEAANAVAQAQRALDDEISGAGGTGVPGCDLRPNIGRCWQRQQDLEQAKARDRRAAEDLVNAETRYGVDDTQLESEIAQAIAAGGGTIDRGTGLLARERALDRLLDEEPALRSRRYFISLLFLLVELLPLIAKILSPPSLHDRNVRVDAADKAHRFTALRTHRRNGFDAGLGVEKHGRDLQHGTTKLSNIAREDIARERIRLDKEYGIAIARLENRDRLSQAVEQRQKTDVMPADDRLIDNLTTEPREFGDLTPPVTSEPQQLQGGWVIDGPLENAEPGGFGRVLRAHHRDDPERPVVVKQVRMLVDDGPDAQAHNQRAARHLEKERRWLAEVNSSHVAEVLGAGDDELYGAFIVTPLYRTTLSKILNDPSAPSMTLEWALRVTEQVLMGLIDCMRGIGLVHLDIKPSNIAIDDDDNVRLIDFGLAKALSTRADAPSTVTPAFSRWYAPLEQLERAANWESSACDVRAVGATLYHMLTGEPPFVRETRQTEWQSERQFYLKYYDMLEKQDPIRPARLVPELPSAVDELVMTWLDRDPNARARGTHAIAVANALDMLSGVQESLQASKTYYMAVGRAAAVDTGVANHTLVQQNNRRRMVATESDVAGEDDAS